MKRRLVPVVEITTRPPKSRARQPSPSTATEPAPSSPRKRRKGDDGTRKQVSSGISISPTVSDYEDATMDCSTNGLVASPTVSDFSAQDTSVTGVTLSPSEEDEEVTLHRPCLPRHRFPDSLPTPLASGSSVTLEAMSTSFEDINGSQSYRVKDDEILEDDDLIIPGETPRDDFESQNEIPLRVLCDFTIYDASTNKLIPIAELLALKHLKQKFSASGLGKPWIEDDENDIEKQNGEDDDDDDEDGNDAQRVKLSTILEFDIHSFSNLTDSMDSKIYIRTKFAWYILDMPSDEYRPLLTPFWIRHRIFHMMVNSAIMTPQMSYDEFLESLQDTDSESDSEMICAVASEDVLACLDMLGRTLTEADVQSDDVRSYIIASLQDICRMHGIPFKSVPLLQTYLGPEDLDSYDDSYAKSKAIRYRRKVADKEQEVLRHRNMTVVTPIVSRIARHLFKESLEVAGTSAFDDADVAAEIDNIQAHHNDPASMKWGSNDLEGQSYGSVVMDGVEYCVGDDVMVNPGDDEDTRRAQNAKADASQSPNSYANRLWFCRICYFFETIVDGKSVKMFHGQWFVHGSKTILQETAHSKSLFLLYKCEDNPIASIFKKCKVTMMGSEDLESPDDGQPDANDFHCSLAYNEKDTEFLDIPGEDELARVLEFSPPSKPCLSCGMQRRQDDLADYMSISNGFSHFGINYHLYDFIYIRPTATAGLLDIGQIVKISSSLQVTVQYFGRYNKLNDKENNFLRSDERHLYLRTKIYILDDLDRIEGVCFIRQLTDSAEIDQWVKHDDHFYVNQQGGDGENGPGLWELKDNVLRDCGICYKKRVEKLRHEQKLLEINGPITCLELFSGAGGLGTGLDISGFVKTKYAVEFSPSAAATYQVNHPEATVYCQDSSLLLKHAIETDAGNNPKPLKSNNGKTYLPHMPKKTEIDMISGGPPCQSFSRANHKPKANDIRSTLPVNMLSYVEHYDPRYFLLENVAGFINYRLMSTHSKNKRSLQGGIEAGMVKFVMRSLIALGYQVRCKLLQAGQYGAPQGRRRVIFWGAKRGNPIPGFPVPLYAFPRKMNRSTLPTGYLHPVSRSLDPEINHQCAPLPAITVDDAIGDLPPFEWINPHEIIPIKDFNKRENKRRREDGIQQFRAAERDREAPFLTGFPKGVEYATAPTNRYQMWLRSKMGDKKVEGQYTRTFSARLVEATTTVPLKPWADHRDLPLVLQPNHAKPGAKQADKSFYGRMDGASQFKCAMTRLAPNVKQSWVLHPSQKRIVSVRECARTQGFPDHYIFISADNAPQKLVANQIRQIGNAVPVPLALHLGKSLGAALLSAWDKNEREGSPVV